jgi:ketosteroid isomerase-like protein
VPATPHAVARYFEAAAEQDFDALTAAFTGDGVVVDEGVTYRGREAIRRWREEIGSKYRYTLTVTGSEEIAEGRYLVETHLVGDFPGGEVDLGYVFALRDGLISELTIA